MYGLIRRYFRQTDIIEYCIQYMYVIKYYEWFSYDNYVVNLN